MLPHSTRPYNATPWLTASQLIAPDLGVSPGTFSRILRRPTLSKRPSFLISKWIIVAGMLSLVATHRFDQFQFAHPVQSQKVEVI